MKYLFIAFILIANISLAQKVNNNDIDIVVKNFLKKHKQTELLNDSYKINKVFSDNSETLLFYVVNFNNAYLIISANKNNTPVKAFSFENKFNLNDGNSIMLDVLKTDYKKYDLFLKENQTLVNNSPQKWNELLNYEQNKNTQEVITYGYWLKSKFGQKWFTQNGNTIYTTNYYTPNHYPVGCVAITLTEMMHYYKYPRKGVDKHSYSDNYGDSKGTYSANFAERYYNWDAVIDEYKGLETTELQQSELGRIAYHSAVALNMNFESAGSTSDVRDIPNVVKKYFRYTADYKEKTASDFWQVVDSNMHHKIPTPMAIYTSSGAGHAIVCDGIRYEADGEKYYHLNMGWWGDDNGWYQIHKTFDAGGYSNITAAVLNMIPVPELYDKPKFDYDTKEVTLKWYYSEEIIPENYEIQIKKGISSIWETLTDTLTKSPYVLKYEGTEKYSIKIRAKIGGEWMDNSWSNTVSFDEDDFKPKGTPELAILVSVVGDEVKISSQNLINSIIQIYDIQGNLVYENEHPKQNIEKVNISNLRKGVYIVRTINSEEQQVTKFLKLY